MSESPRTQKQIAERFRGTLDYFKKPHYLRRARLWLSVGCCAASLVAIAVYQHLGSPKFYSSGPLSAPHAALENNCAACHDPARLHATEFERLAGIDQACQKCHASHGLHAPNVPRSESCTTCHKEHLDHGPMRQVADTRCASCHGDASVMAEAGRRGVRLPPELFARQPAQGLRVMTPPRPTNGGTNVFHTFADHPEFQLIAQRLREPNTLRFNHRRHLAADIPDIEGRRLDCNFCHVPDASGHFFQRLSFAQHCQACHTLNFDAQAPGLEIPHGSPEFVRAYLRNLPGQYAEEATRQGVTGSDGRDEFVRRSLARLRERFGSGEALEQQIFFNNQAGRLEKSGNGETLAARVTGCAYCHPVQAAADGAPRVAAPQIPDRWLAEGTFNHGRHTAMNCTDCHAAKSSSETADVLLPSQKSCAQCHGREGRASESCASCHRYHARPEPVVADEWRRHLREQADK